MKNKVKSWLFKIPAIIILIVVVIGSFYAKIKNLISPLSWATPITILIIFILYVIGEYFGQKEDSFY